MIKRWLERIFSLQTLSVIISLVALYYTIRNFCDKEVEPLAVQIPIFNDERYEFDFKSVEGVSNYWSLGVYDCPIVDFTGVLGGPYNMLHFPIIANTADKSVNNFKCVVHIYFDTCMSSIISNNISNPDFINTVDFDIIRYTDNNLTLKYKHSNLTAYSLLSCPIKYFFLGEASDDIYTEGGYLSFNYDITYDGAINPIRFNYVARMYIDESPDDILVEKSINEKIINKFLRNDVFSNWVGNRKDDDGEWAILVNGEIYRNIKHLSSKEFERFKYNSIDDLQLEQP